MSRRRRPKSPASRAPICGLGATHWLQRPPITLGHRVTAGQFARGEKSVKGSTSTVWVWRRSHEPAKIVKLFYEIVAYSYSLFGGISIVFDRIIEIGI